MTILYSERRRILLIDENSRKLNLLTTILRNHEVEVHPAACLEDAKSLWKNIPYDLVLLAAPENSEQATLVSLQIRKTKPRQRIALLVGPPAYIREHGVTALEVNECDLDYAFGTTTTMWEPYPPTANGCASWGVMGPDSGYKGSAADAIIGQPTATSVRAGNTGLVNGTHF
jgi:CheY-like chemotaxis protein